MEGAFLEFKSSRFPESRSTIDIADMIKDRRTKFWTKARLIVEG